MTQRYARLRLLLILALVFIVPAAAAHAQSSVSITALGTPVTQNFDTLASTGTSSVVPAGWLFVETGTNANLVYTAGTGSSATGDTYSFGSLASPGDRAFGGLQSGSLVPTIGAAFTNNTGATVNALAIAYTGEQWRLGALARLDRLDFQYSTSATSLTTGTWIDANQLDFVAPATGPTAGALDGNLAANRTAITFTITGLNIPNGATFWIRWASFDASGADDGLAVDDFSLTALFQVVPTNPSGVGAASPGSIYPGDTTLLTVAVTPGSNPTSSGLAVSANLASIGGSATQTFYDDGTHGDATAGDNIFSFSATVAPVTTPGAKSLPASITDAEARSAGATIALTVVAVPVPSTSLVISQVYGGGGNSGATLKNDFIEIYNLGPAPVSVTGWSVQYAAATGTSWQTTPLSGTILPGRFYLVQEAAGGGGTVNLPTPDASGGIAMAAGAGKVALVSSTTALSGACPASAAIVDLVGYGSTATCSETSPTPTLSATTAAIRNGNGSIDTNNNLADFSIGAPAPSNSTGRPPVGAGAATPASLSAGESTLLTVTVTPGNFPASTSVSVTGNLGTIGGSTTQTFFDDGTNGDAAGGDNVFSFLAAVPVSSTVGSRTLPITVADDLARTSTTSITLIVEPAIVAIHAIQGDGVMSPLNGQLVATKGIVIGRTYNGFYIQAPDADTDGDPNTSEGIFVFTNTSTTLATGTYVKVAGTVSEYVPSTDSNSPPITEIGGTPSVTVLATGVPLPAAASLTAFDTSPASFAALERFEGMLVRVDALRVVAPTQAAYVDEPNAQSTSNGVFYGVVDGVARPFREAGIPLPDPLPSGAPCCVPRFDENPERLRIDSDGQTGASPIEVPAGALVSNLTGPLTYSYRTWTILPDPAMPPSVSAPLGAVPVPEPSASEFTVGAFNLERFFDTENNSSAPVLTATAFTNRLNKASLAIRNVMRMPDILGVEEVENLSTLQALASKINADAAAALQPVPGYVAYLEEGNDVGGIDVGFLVKSARVGVVDVTQVGKDATYIVPGTGLPALLNDRPPLVLRALIQGPIGSPFPVTVIVNHLRSLNGVEDPVDDRVRVKRAAQAEFLANLIQGRQLADPTERIVSVGDYNAFAVNDGYVDVMGTVKGQPTPADQVVVASPPLLNPVMTNLVDLVPPDQAYSYSFDGNIQAIDHVVANASLMKRYSRFHYARNDADFPESYRNDPNRPERISDHDMPVAYFAFPGAPTLTLNGPNPMSVECCTAFVDPGASASDADLGDLTSSIVTTGTVDSNTVGTYTLTYSVSNGFVTTTMTRTVNVVDTVPPVVTLNGPGSMTIELGSAYTEPGASASDTCAGSLAVQISGTVNTGAVGSYAITYTAFDGYNTTSVTRTVVVVDTTAPTVTAVSASPNVLWPPNGQMVPVAITVSVTDLGGAAACGITQVTSSEPALVKGAGRTATDWTITGPLTLFLRAERSGRSTGRTYTVGISCSDASGNVATGTATVLVPHDQRK